MLKFGLKTQFLHESVQVFSSKTKPDLVGASVSITGQPLNIHQSRHPPPRHPYTKTQLSQARSFAQHVEIYYKP